MTDLVERLRRPPIDGFDTRMLEAADEIERLRTKLATITALEFTGWSAQRRMEAMAEKAREALNDGLS